MLKRRAFFRFTFADSLFISLDFRTESGELPFLLRNLFGVLGVARRKETKAEEKTAREQEGQGNVSAHYCCQRTRSAFVGMLKLNSTALVLMETSE